MSFMLSRTSLELPVLFKYQVTWQLLVIMTAMVDHVQLEKKFRNLFWGKIFNTFYFIFFFTFFLEKRPLLLLYILYLLHFVFGVNVPLFLLFSKKKSFRILQIPQIFNIFFVVSITQYTIDSIGKMILVINLENQIHRKQVTNYFRFPQVTPRNLSGSEYMFMTFVSKIILFLLILIYCIVFQRC